MAYVLGFWFADGYMRHERSYNISFSSVDLGHLKLIRKTLGSTSPITRFRRHGKFERTHALYVRSKILYYDLLVLGGTRNKSRILKFPFVPKQFLPDFIRGYFDGDGSVHHVTYKHSKNGKFYTNIRSNFTCGNFSFLEKIRDYLTKELGLYKRKICGVGKPPTRWKLGYAQEDTRKLLKYMYYPNHEVSLQRKAAYLKHFI